MNHFEGTSWFMARLKDTTAPHILYHLRNPKFLTTWWVGGAKKNEFIINKNLNYLKIKAFSVCADSKDGGISAAMF